MTIYQITEADAREHTRALRHLAGKALLHMMGQGETVSSVELEALALLFERACKPPRDPDIPDLEGGDAA